MANSNGLSCYAFVQFIAFVFVGIGTFIDMFRLKNRELFGNTECLSLWGNKRMCYSLNFDEPLAIMFQECPGKLDCFLTAQRFAQVSLVVIGFAAAVGITFLLCFPCFRWVCFLLNITATVTGGIVVACIVYAYYNNLGTNSACLRQEVWYKFGIGFQLFVAGWCLNIITTSLLLPLGNMTDSN